MIVASRSPRPLPPAMQICFSSTRSWSALEPLLIDGIGSPRPRPQTSSKLVLSNILELTLILHLSKLVIWGSSLGRGVPISVGYQEAWRAVVLAALC